MPCVCPVIRNDLRYKNVSSCDAIPRKNLLVITPSFSALSGQRSETLKINFAPLNLLISHPLIPRKREGDSQKTKSNLPLIFFFFQAEDGIRDHCVTGVQTCALPI